MSGLLAIVAAFCNAFVVVAQRLASVNTPREQKGLRLGLTLVRNPLWLLGILGMATAFVLQALALYLGQLSIVQPLMVTELVFALVLRATWLHQRVPFTAWRAATITCVSLAVFVVVAEPRDGHPSPTSAAWLSAIVVLGVVTGALTLVARSGSPKRRAAGYAAAASVVDALDAAFVKTATDTLSAGGVAGLLTHWPLYALAVTGVAGFVLTQAAFRVGPIMVSQPVLATVNPFVSVGLGVWLFGEHFTNTQAEIALACAAFVVMVLGVILMCRADMPTLERVPPPDAHA